jgi:hypothetical protein
MAEEPVDPTRRAALKTLAAGIGAVVVWPYLSDEAAAAFARIQATQAPPSLTFLTQAEYAAVDLLVETIIPADEQSPGAREARVADYLDLLLAESSADVQQRWRDGLAGLDAAARSRYQRPFAELSAPDATAVLTTIAQHEGKPQTPLEVFFKDAKDATIRGYYTSEIGIHRELQYKGNQMLAEFTGCTHPEHGYAIPRS